MKNSISLLTKMVVSLTLFCGVATVGSREVNLGVPAETTSYCDMMFSMIGEDSLFWGNPMLNESAGNSIDYYGSCDHDPFGRDEIRTPRELIMPFADDDFRR